MTSSRLPERIVTGEVVIRRWNPTDVGAMQHLIADSLDHLRPWMAWAHTEPLANEARLRLFERWDRYWTSGAGAIYAVVVDDELVGGCSLHRRVGPGGIDLGYWLGHRGTGRGIATDAAAALTAAASARDDVDFVQISHAPTNDASGAVARRLGFVNVLGDAVGTVTTWRRTRDRPDGAAVVRDSCQSRARR